MPRRTLAVLGVAAFGALALPFGLPQTAQASGTIASISLMPFPIAQAGTLVAGQTVDLCIQPRNSANQPMGPGQPVFLSFYSGLFTAPPAPGGTATVNGTPLTTTPTSYNTVASCTWTGGTAPSADAIPVVYTAPATLPAHGRDVIIAADNATDSGTGGVCANTGVCNNGTYVYSPVAAYVYTPAQPIAPTGSLTAGEIVNFTVTAEDSGGHDVPGSFINLALTSTASSEGSATAFNHFSGFPADKVTNTPERFGSDSNGTVQIAYKAGSATTGVDTITAQDHPNTPTFTPVTTTYTYGTATPPARNPYTAVAPFRICDTRPAGGGISSNQCNTGAGSGPIGNNTFRSVAVTGAITGGVVPTTATAIVVNLTAIAPTTSTYVTLYPAGGTHTTSNDNPAKGAVVATLVEVGIGTGGAIDVYNAAGSINVALDIEGYVDASSTALYNPTAPDRICDTRAAGGGVSSNQCNLSGAAPLGIGGTVTFNVHTANDGVPASGVSAVVFNLTGIDPSVATDLTAYAGGAVRPNASNLNLAAKTAVPNRVIVPVSNTGTVTIWNGLGSINVAVDIDGWFQTGTGSQFTALPSPARVCDTRVGGNAQGCSTPGTVRAGGVLNINVTGIDGIPTMSSSPAPTAIVANITVVNATTGTFVTVYPGNLSLPNASDLNVPSLLPVTNLVVVGLGPDGTINLYNALGNVNLIVDVYGYYTS
jgi:hypothetical protein